LFSYSISITVSNPFRFPFFYTFQPTLNGSGGRRFSVRRRASVGGGGVAGDSDAGKSISFESWRGVESAQSEGQPQTS